MALRSGGRILVDNLLLREVDTAFCVPGESFLGALDALHDSADRLRLVTCRHESGAGNMAEAYGKLTGKPGICFVTRGPGAMHAAIALHTARQDSTPMILFIGQVGRGMLGREAFQEIDYRRMLGEVTKWVDQVESAARLPEYVSRAFAIATSGRMGPVALVLPEDILTELADVADVPAQTVAEPSPAPSQMAALAGLLHAAQRPLMIVGGSGWTDRTSDDMTAFAEAHSLPVVAGFRCQDRIDNTRAVYIGELGSSVAPALAARVKEADLLLVVGDRLGEMTTSGYSLIEAPQPRQALIHVLPGAEELGRVFRADLAINAGVGPFFAAARLLPHDGEVPWRAWAAEGRKSFVDAMQARTFPGKIDFNVLMAALRDRLGPSAIITTGAGNYTAWAQRYYLYREPRTQLAPLSGAMGYGVPAAIAAKIVHPGRDVVCFAGDGCFTMSLQELATAAQYGLNPVFLVFDNAMYGTIRMHQEMRYPDRTIATDLTNPDFARLAECFGGHGETVETTDDFAPALERCLSSGKLAVMHIRVDPEAISYKASLSELRRRASAE